MALRQAADRAVARCERIFRHIEHVMDLGGEPSPALLAEYDNAIRRAEVAQLLCATSGREAEEPERGTR